MSANILIVDDSHFARQATRRILEAQGHRITEAEDSGQALKNYSADRPDLVVLDLVMPEVDGFAVMRQLRQVDPTARIIIASADIQIQTYNAALAAGAAGFINKPIRGEEMRGLLAKVLGPS